MSDYIALLIVLAIGAWFFAASIFSRQAVWLLVLWIPIQGWVQLNLLNDSSSTVLIYEFQVVGIYIVFGIRALRSRQAYRPPPVVWYALPFIVWAVLLIPFSLNRTGLLLTLLGLRTYLLPLPLVWIGYYAFRTRKELENLGWAIMVQLALIAALAALQFVSLVTAVGSSVDVPTGFNIAGVLRPPGTFSAPGHFGMYILASIPLGIGFLGLGVDARKRVGYLIGLLGGVVSLIVNSQRATVMLLAVTLPLIVLLARRLNALKAMIAAILVAVLGWSIGTQVVGGAFAQRIATISEDFETSLITAPVARLQDALQTPVFGGGLGLASPGVGRLEQPSESGRSFRFRMTGKPAESFMAAIVYQVGVPGLIFFYVLIVALLFRGYHVVQICRNTDMGLLAASILGFMVAVCLQSWTYDPLHYPPCRVLFWFWAGVLLSIPRLSAQAVYARQQRYQHMLAVIRRRVVARSGPSTPRGLMPPTTH